MERRILDLLLAIWDLELNLMALWFLFFHFPIRVSMQITNLQSLMPKNFQRIESKL